MVYTSVAFSGYGASSAVVDSLYNPTFEETVNVLRDTPMYGLLTTRARTF